MKRDKSSDAADRFVDAVYRRWLVVNFFEQLGRGLFVSSLLAAGLLSIAIWQAIPTFPILIFTAVFGLFLGVTLAIYRRPNRLAAAVEADRQLRLDDLLTSAVFSAGGANDDFRAIVQQMANARCAGRSPSEVLFRRFGIRRWSGITLAVGIAVTLASIPLQPSRSQAVDANISVLAENRSDLKQISHADRGMIPVFHDPMSDGASSSSMSTETPDADPANSSQSNESPGTKSGGSAAGTGGGSASSKSSQPRDLPPGQSPGRPPDRDGVAASGGAASHSQDAHGDASSRAGGAAANPMHPTPAWSGNATSDSPNAAATANDHIPPEDRDLVRDFFGK